MNLYRHKKTKHLHIMIEIDEHPHSGLRARYERIGGSSGVREEPTLVMPLEQFFNTHDQITEIDVTRWREAFDARQR